MPIKEIMPILRSQNQTGKAIHNEPSQPLDHFTKHWHHASLKRKPVRPFTTPIQSHDLEIEIIPSAPIARLGKRIQWQIIVTNHAQTTANQVQLTIHMARAVIDTRLNQEMRACDYTSFAKTIGCQIESLPAGGQSIFSISAMVPRTTQATQFLLQAQVEGNSPDPYLQNNQTTSAVPLGHQKFSIPPSGFVFAHIRHTTPNNSALYESDYLGDELITAVLQRPFDFAFAYHTETLPEICFVTIQPCPAEARLLGQVHLSAFTIRRVVRLADEAQILFDGAIRQEVNRTAVSSPSACIWGRCAAYGLFQAERFAWQDTDIVSIVPFTKGGRTAECHTHCLELANAIPGYYRIEGNIELLVLYDNRPELTQTYQLESHATLRLVAPFIISTEPEK